MHIHGFDSIKAELIADGITFDTKQSSNFFYREVLDTVAVTDCLRDAGYSGGPVELSGMRSSREVFVYFLYDSARHTSPEARILAKTRYR